MWKGLSGEENPTLEELREWYRMSGLSLKRFFNTSGNIYKEMSLKDKLPSMSEGRAAGASGHGRDAGEKDRWWWGMAFCSPDLRRRSGRKSCCRF